MKPVYQSFLEKNMHQMVVSAAEITVANATNVTNGKLHKA